MMQETSWLKRVAFAAAALMAMGADAAELPVAGAAFHVDASATSTLTTVEVNGTNFVTKWADASGGSRYASQDKAELRPWIDYENGLPFVDFGPGRYVGREPYGQTGFLKWSSTDSSIREIFLVYSDYPEKSGSFILSAAGSYQFHRAGKKLFNTQYAEAKLRNGVIEVDGAGVDNNTYELPEGFHIIHLRTTGGVTADRFASDRDQYQQGAQRLREVIVYDSVLSNEQAAEVYGYLYDKWWCGPDQLLVAGFPEDIGDVSPSYGVRRGLAAEESVPCSASVAWTNDADTVRAVCAGWRLSDLEGNQVDSGTAASFNYVHPNPADYRKLVWQWTVECKVSVTAVAGATVTEPERFVAYGGTAEFPIECDGAHAVSTVSGGVYRNGKIVVENVTAPVDVTVTLADAWYVKPDGDDAAAGHSPDTAFATVRRALEAAADGDTIYVASGEYAPTETVAVSKKVTVIGAGRDNTVFRGGAVNFIAFSLVAGATVRDLSIVGYTNSVYTSGCGVKMSGGTLENVRIARIRQGNGDYAAPALGTGLYMSGGTVTNCVVEDCLAWGGYGGTKGIGVYMTGGTLVGCDILRNARQRTQFYGGGVCVEGDSAKVIRCRIAGNNSGGNLSGDTRGMGVSMTKGLVEDCTIVSNAHHAVHMTGGTLRNCLVWGHSTSSADYTAGVDMSNGTMENCTVAGNAANNAFAGLKMTGGTSVNNIVYANGAKGSALVSGGTFNHNIVDDKSVITTTSASDNIVSDPKLKGIANGDFTIGFDSPAVDAAATRANVTHDLAGTARPQGVAPDIGCYEYLPSGDAMDCAIIINNAIWRGGQSPTASARAVGGSGNYTYAWYVDDVLSSETSAAPAFAGLACGNHKLRLVVSDGVHSAEATVENAFTLMPCEVWVDANGGNVFPFDTPQKAAHSFNDAFDAVWSKADSTGVVHVAAGDYVVSSSLNLTMPYVIAGAGRDATTLVGRDLAWGTRLLNISHSGCTVRDLSVSGCTNRCEGLAVKMSAGRLENVRIHHNKEAYGGTSGNLSVGVGLNLSGGTVTNCVIDANVADDGYGNFSGAGVYMTGGTVVDSIIEGNKRPGSQTSGAGIYMNGSTAKMIRCRIAGNGSGCSAGCRGMGVKIEGYGGLVEDCVIVSNAHHGVLISAGTLRNCLVWGHSTSSADYTAGVEMTGGTMENCTVADNAANNAFAGLKMTGGTAVNTIISKNGDKGSALVSGGTFNHNIVDDKSVISTTAASDNIVSDPKLKAIANGDFTIGFDSPAVDAAVTRANVTHDLAGTARPQGTAPDIGCYEFTPSADKMECAIIVNTSVWRGGQSPTAAARVIGGSGTYSYTWYVDGVMSAEKSATPAFSGLSCGSHTIRLVVSDGTVSAEATYPDAFMLMPGEVWVSADGDNEFPYDSEKKAARSIGDAMATVWSKNDSTGIVHVAAGTYDVASTLNLTTPYLIAGAGRDATTLVGPGLAWGTRLLNISHSGCTVRDLSVSGCTNRCEGLAVRMSAGRLENVRIHHNKESYGGTSGNLSVGVGLNLSGGTVTNCVIDANVADDGYGGFSGAGIYMTGGTVVDSVIEGNKRPGSQTTGCGVYMNGSAARMIRCRIAGNGSGCSAGCRGMGVKIEGNGGLLEDCVIVSNAHHGVLVSAGTLRNCLITGHSVGNANYTAGVEMSGGTMVNCTLAGNTNTVDAAKGDLALSGGTVKNTIARFASVSGGTSANNVFNEPVAFKNPAKGNFRLSSAAVNCIDRGDDSVWNGIADPVDLDGNPRIRKHTAVDIGCYELNAAGLFLIVR